VPSCDKLPADNPAFAFKKPNNNNNNNNQQYSLTHHTHADTKRKLPYSITHIAACTTHNTQAQAQAHNTHKRTQETRRYAGKKHLPIRIAIPALCKGRQKK
jgi:hypothetical protein